MENTTMPIYAFKCDKCGHEFEELVSRMDGSAPCPQCSAKKVNRMLTAPADYRGTTGSPGSPGKSDACRMSPSGGGGCCCGGACSHSH
ncbi:MAG: zinc ribbon domain-containing protein [Phycisphaeraceae bacterium]